MTASLTRAEKLQKLAQAKQQLGNLLPLSAAQQRFWFIEQLDTASGLNNIFKAQFITEPLDISLLQQALHAITQRHPALGSRFINTRNGPRQYTVPAPATLIKLMEVATLNEAKTLASTDARQGFALSSQLPFRCTLYQLPQQQYLLTLCIHHIVADGYALNLILSELHSLYRQLQGQPLPQLPLPAIDMQQYLQQQQLTTTLQSEQFWQSTLQHCEYQLQLSRHTDSADNTGDYYYFSLPADLSEQVSQYCQQQHITPFNLLLACFNILLHKLSGQRNFIVATPVLNRDQPQLKHFVAAVANTLLLPAAIDSNMAAGQYVQQLRQQFYQCLAHQQLGYSQILELLQPERDINRNPLFQVMFSYNALQDAIAASADNWQSCAIQRHYAKLDLTLELTCQQGGYHGYFEYNKALFSEQDISRYTDFFAEVVQQLIQQPQRPLAQLALSSLTQQQQLLSYPPLPAATDKDLMAALAKTAGSVPQQHALTLTDSGQQLSYQQLWQLVLHYNALLQQNQQQSGLATTSVIAISCQHRLQAIVAMLSVLAAGGCFVIIEPGISAQRKQFLYHDSQASLTLTDQPATDGILIELNPATLLHSVLAETKPDQPAYLVYTSGTSGTPKGVVISRQALSNHASSMMQHYQLSQCRTSLQSSALSFDLALEEIFPPLIAGCHLLLPVQQQALTFARLQQLVEQYQIEHLSLSTAYWHSWISTLLQTQQPLPASIRQIIIGTEQLTGAAVQSWFSLSRSQQVALFNAYGPSEATISCSVHQVVPQDQALAAVPVGKAILPNRLYVLDTDLMPVPAQVTAELYIAGDNLALGYHNQPELTAGKFIHHPLSGERLYATGDRAYYLDDGNICFAGRNDQQVKLRGYRIELEGIRQQILRYSAVAQCHVTVLEPEQLVAYLVAAGNNLDPAALQQYLQPLLPDYMQPQHFILLNALPLTNRGKVDTARLPRPETTGNTDEQAAGNDLIEHTLLEIWQQLLPGRQLQMTQNFFSAGGHSLLALSMLARIKDSLHSDISLRQFFAQPTIRALAQLVRQHTGSQRTVPLLRQPEQSTFPLTSAQQQMWVLHQLDGSGAAYNMPMLLQLNGELDKASLLQVLRQICQQQAAFYTIYAENNGTVFQRLHHTAELQFSEQDLSAMPQTLAQRFAADANTAFDLTAAPAYRFILYKLAAQSHALGVVMHHINADGSSFQLLLRQLCQGYRKLVQQQHWQAAKPQLQMVDLALWQQHPDYRQWQQQQLDYWQQQLKDVPQLLELATDFPRPPVPSFRGGRCRFTIPADTLGALKQQAEQLGVSLYMLSFAVCGQLLHEFSRQDDFVIGIPVSGRDSTQCDELIGLLLNTLPVRLQWQPQMTCKQLVAQVKQHILTGFEHQQIQLPQLLQLLNIGRSTSHNPLFQVLFNFNHSTAAAENEIAVTEQLSLAMPDSDNHSARFDLNFSLTLQGTNLSGFIEYSTDLFLPASVELMVTRLQQLFGQFGHDTARPLAALEQEQQAAFMTLLPQSKPGSTPAFDNLSSWFAATAGHYADKQALIAADRRLSYQQLQTETEALAASLYQAGIRPGDLVAVCVPRDSQLIITLLAIFRCQAAYLPLDPDYPQERLQYIVSDAAVRAIISTAELQARMALQGAPVLLLSQLQQTTAAALPPLQHQPQQLAYCIYTSGSTGLPKGVEISQHSMLNFLHAMATEPGISATDKLLAVTPVSFDISVLELFLPLLHGASLVLLPNQQNRDGESIARHLHEHQISIMQATPAGWRLLLESGWSGQPGLTMLIGGEALPRVLAQRLLDKGRQLWNMYGPTEATVWVSCQQITAANLNQISTGLAISNNRLYVMNAAAELAAIGSKGELYIAGDNLALGYRGKVELTAERFITKQWHNGRQERLYRTGDLVKQLADGRLLYLQRLDEQVKLHGYRIELTEIEAVAERYAGITACAVVLCQAGNGEPLLVAFFTAQQVLDTTALTAHATAWLPSYMVPTLWQQLDALPTTPSGKVDKKQLRQRELTEQQPQQDLATATEQQLANLWQQLLGINVGNRHSNFFRLGGNSVLAMKLLALIRRQFGEHLPLALGDLFAYQQLDQLANRLDELQLQTVDEDELLALMAEITG
ncbi:amino acid adenylation domain-containing protein [Rheinheimera pacifica]|uniref:non-ribosomal peptide synthetase n=1 Tax=Rheinheimera pacifica TaxID=173990 RepID=UPI00216A039F|nr:non-ribosomal peptide synthetase [Rheinheimera pacifica]MCS4307004.1 amino acid adenylation domain-containing protein [Rheinheimera pacifica]